MNKRNIVIIAIIILAIIMLAFKDRSKVNNSYQSGSLQNLGPLQDAQIVQNFSPLKYDGLLQSAGPLQNSEPLATSTPFQQTGPIPGNMILVENSMQLDLSIPYVQVQEVVFLPGAIGLGNNTMQQISKFLISPEVNDSDSLDKMVNNVPYGSNSNTVLPPPIYNPSTPSNVSPN